MSRTPRILRVLLLALLALAWGLSSAQGQRRAPAARAPAAQAPAPAPVPATPVALPAQAPLDRQIDMIRRILPQAKRVGLIYDPGEPASVAAVKQLLDLLPKAGMNPVEITTPHTWDVGPAARNLIGRVDLVYTVFDDNVSAAYDVLAQACDQARIPLFAADPDKVRLGAMASLGLPGREQAPDAPVAGRPARPVRPERPLVAGTWLYLNADAAARQGVTVPDDVLKSAVLVRQANAGKTNSNPPKKADGVKP